MQVIETAAAQPARDRARLRPAGAHDPRGRVSHFREADRQAHRDPTASRSRARACLRSCATSTARSGWPIRPWRSWRRRARATGSSDFTLYANQRSKVPPERQQRLARRWRPNEEAERIARATAQPRSERSGPLAHRRSRSARSCCSSCLPPPPALLVLRLEGQEARNCSRRAPRKPSCGRRSRARRARPQISRPTRTSSPRWSNPSAPCCASCRTRPKCRTCWSTSRRRAWPQGSRRSCSSRRARISKDFYAELPIKIRLTGNYHEIGSFVSGIAALPRIVTLHDIEIVPAGREAGASGDLQLERDRQDLSLPRRRGAGGRPATPARRAAEELMQPWRRPRCT